MMRPLINISPLGSLYVLGIPLAACVEYARRELAEHNVQENQNCIYLENLVVNSDLPQIDKIIFSKSKEPEWQGFIDSISIHIMPAINQCEHTWNYFKRLFKGMNLSYVEKNEGSVCTLTYKTRLCQISMLKQYGVNTNPNICPFCIRLSSQFLIQGRYDTTLIKGLFHDKIDYLTENMPTNSIKSINLKYILIFLFSIVLCMLIFLFALNGRYMKTEDCIVFDKWTSKYIECP